MGLPQVFLGGLEGSMSEESIRSACSNFGQIVEVQMMNDREARRCALCCHACLGGAKGSGGERGGDRR